MAVLSGTFLSPCMAAQPTAPAVPRVGDADVAMARGLRSATVSGADATGLRLHRDPGVPGVAGSGRVEAVWPLAEGRGELRATLRPAVGSIDPSDAAAQTIALSGAAPASAAGWRLDAPRVTWRRAWIDSPELKLRLGVTARLRDSGAGAGQGPLLSSRSDGGFVPLLHASFEQRLGDRFSLLADVDAMVPGGATMLDAGVRLRYDFNQAWAGTMAYRLLDGASAGRESGVAMRQQSLSMGLQYRW